MRTAERIAAIDRHLSAKTPKRGGRRQCSERATRINQLLDARLCLMAERDAKPSEANPMTTPIETPHGSCLICGHDKPFGVWKAGTDCGVCVQCRDMRRALEAIAALPTNQAAPDNQCAAVVIAMGALSSPNPQTP
jgi:hypothetical protein